MPSPASALSGERLRTCRALPSSDLAGAGARTSTWTVADQNGATTLSGGSTLAILLPQTRPEGRLTHRNETMQPTTNPEDNRL